MAFETSLTIDVDTRKAQTDLARLDRSLKTTGRTSDKTTKKMEGSFTRLRKSVVSLKGAFGALVAGAFLRKLIQVGSTFEQLRIQLKTVTGSAALAEKEFTRIKQLAIDTPFEVENLTNSFIRLKAIGIQPTTELLKAFGDVAAGLGRDVTEFTSAAVGAAFGETQALKSFGIAAKVEGEKIAFTFKGITTVVDSEVNAVIGALQKIGSENFAGAANAQVNSFKGAMSNLADATSQFLDLIARTGLLTFFADGIRLMTAAVEGLSGAFGEFFGGEEDLSVGGIKSQIAEVEAELSKAKEVFEGLGGAASKGAVLRELAGEFLPFIDNVKELEARLFTLRERLKDAQGAGVAGPTPPTPGRVKGEKFATNTLKSLEDENALSKIRIDNFGKSAEAIERLIELQKIDFAIRDGALELSVKELSLLSSQINLKSQAATKLDDLAKGKAVFEDNLTPLEEYNKGLVELNRLLEIGAIDQETFNRGQLKNTEAFIEANPVLSKMESGMHSFSDALIDGAVQGKSFADTMKSTFRSLATDILKELNRVIISKAFSSLIGGSLGSLFGGSTTGSGFNTGQVAQSQAQFGNPFELRASGGPVRGGTPYIVGEKGPELFVPKASGDIVPNHKMGGGSGGGGTVINIDARGSNGDEAVMAAVEAGIRRAAPNLINASVNRVKDERSRDPDFFGRGAVA